MVVAEIVGFWFVLLNPSGPDQFQVGVPVEGVDAVKFNDSPAHKALLFPANGAAGGFGSVKLNGPTGEDGQLFNTTYTPE